jgi:hypothetical protein
VNQVKVLSGYAAVMGDNFSLPAIIDRQPLLKSGKAEIEDDPGVRRPAQMPI